MFENQLTGILLNPEEIIREQWDVETACALSAPYLKYFTDWLHNGMKKRRTGNCVKNKLWDLGAQKATSAWDSK